MLVAATVASGIITISGMIGLVLYLQGPSALPTFAAVIAIVMGIWTVIAFSRLHKRVGFSNLGVHVEYRLGRTRVFEWADFARVHLSHHYGDDFADIYYKDGRRAWRANLYGRAARELDTRFKRYVAETYGNYADERNL